MIVLGGRTNTVGENVLMEIYEFISKVKRSGRPISRSDFIDVLPGGT